MDAIKIKKVFFTLFLVMISIQSAFAEMMEKGKTRVKTLLNLYAQDGHSGRQVIDESGIEHVKVIEPQIFVIHQITEDTELNASFTLDSWTAESDTILDGVTGASGEGKKGQSRIAPNIGLRKEVGKSTFGVNLGFSSEYDYTSKSISLDAERKFAEDNFTLGVSLQYYADELSLFKDLSPLASAQITEGFNRDIMAINVGASQILTRKDIIELGAMLATSKGTLESTAGTVRVNGARTLESLPDERERVALTTKWVHAYDEFNALNFSYRNYFDDWGMKAHSVRAAHLISLRDDLDFLELAVRYHTQRAVDYYQDAFAGPKNFMTSDSDMNKFHSMEYSLMYSRNLEGLQILGINLEDCEITNGLTYAERSNDMKYGYFQTSLAFNF